MGGILTRSLSHLPQVELGFSKIRRPEWISSKTLFAPLRLYPQRRSLTGSIKFEAGVKIHSIRGAIQSPLVVIPAQIDPARRWAGPYRQAIFITLKDVEIQCAVRWDGLDLVKAFMSLPSLTSIKTDSLFLEGRAYQAGSATLPQPSNISKLYVWSGSLPENRFSSSCGE